MELTVKFFIQFSANSQSTSLDLNVRRALQTGCMESEASLAFLRDKALLQEISMTSDGLVYLRLRILADSQRVGKNEEEGDERLPVSVIGRRTKADYESAFQFNRIVHVKS